MKILFKIISAFMFMVGIVSPALYAADIKVSGYGAVAGDGRDDSIAIQAAIKAAINKPDSVVLFDPGIYDIAAIQGSNRALEVAGASNLKINGAGATLRVHSVSNGIIIRDSTNISLENLSFEWSSLPFSQARVVSVENNDLIVSIVGGTTPSTAGTPVTSLFLYDEVKRRPAAGGNDWYVGGTFTGQGGGKARLSGFPSYLSRVGVGASLLIRFQTYGANAIVCFNNRQLTFTRVSVHSAPGMAAALSGCEDVQFSYFRVLPRIDAPQWISTNADGIHATDCRGNFSVSNSVFKALGDDAINIGGLMLLSQKGTTAREVVLHHGRAQGIGVSPPRVGDLLKFSSINEPYKVVFSASVVTSLATGLPVQQTVTLDADVPVALQSQAVVFNSSARPVINLSRISIERNRARGFWLQGISGDVKDCTVSGSSGPAVELRSDVYDSWEGPAPTAVRFDNCSFGDCNYGPGKSVALINSYALDSTGSISAIRAIDTIAFSHCEFIADGQLLSFKSTRSVTIANSKYSSKTATPVVADDTTMLLESTNNVPGAGFKLVSPIAPTISIK
ncbi:MAG: hypothetical protein IPP19_12905 [Verrucomicrobia bacterium]|nr:hypothetical protein [Verrucomicrobiota bacterium]